MDVFNHDNGVVDHQADGQDHGQQRQQVEAETQRKHDRSSAKQRQRNTQDRYGNGAHGA
ncbi:hypothetical protein D9M71_775940 [compost metagenome]